MKIKIIFVLFGIIAITSCVTGDPDQGNFSRIIDTERPSNLMAGLRSEFERFEGSKKEEHKLIVELKNNFKRSQLIKANQSGGKLLRGTHAKGICATAQFTVNENLPDRLRAGFFSEGTSKQVPARIRFANASGKINPDSMPDVRAISVSVTDGVRRMDFSMNNDKVFTVPSLTAFNLLLEFNFAVGASIQQASVVAGQSLSPEKIKTLQKAAMVEVIQKRKLDVATWADVLQKMIIRGARQTGKPINYFRANTYWTGTAFKFGQNAAKYALTPCASSYAMAKPSIKDDLQNNPNFLQDEFKSYLNNNQNAPICFDFQVQIFDRSKVQLSDDEAVNWIEDPTIEWDDSKLPFEKIGRLIINQGSVLSSQDCDSRDNGFDSAAYNMEEHQGLGRINRGRSASERISRESRTKGI